MLVIRYHKMSESMQDVSVVRDDGTRGTIIADTKQGQLVVEFNDGSRLVVSPKALVAQRDGTYRLSPGAAEQGEVVIPVIAEELTVETQRVARGKVRVNKRVVSREEVVDAPVVREEVVVERIPVNKYIDDMEPELTDEDGVLVIPVIEEVLVVEKRLFMREKVRVFKRRSTTSTPQTVVLRSEVVDIEREELDSTESRENDISQK